MNNSTIIVSRSRKDDFAGLTDSELRYINFYQGCSTDAKNFLRIGDNSFEKNANFISDEIKPAQVCCNFAMGWKDKMNGWLDFICRHLCREGMSTLKYFVDFTICNFDPQLGIKVAYDENYVPAGYHLAAMLLLGDNKPGEPFHYHDFHFYRKMSNGFWYYKVGSADVVSRHVLDGGRILSISPNLDGSAKFITTDHQFRPMFCRDFDAARKYLSSRRYLNGDVISISSAENFVETTKFVGYYLVPDFNDSF